VGKNRGETGGRENVKAARGTESTTVNNARRETGPHPDRNARNSEGAGTHGGLWE